MNFKWFKKSKEKTLSLSSLLKDYNTLILEPLTNNLKPDWTQITKNSLTFFKYLLEHFKPASNTYLNLTEQTKITRKSIDMKLLNENKLLRILLKGDSMYGMKWYSYYLLDEDFDHNDYDNALNNLINAYLEDQRKFKPILLSDTSSLNINFFSETSFINENKDLFNNISIKDVLYDENDRLRYLIKYNNNSYYLNALNPWTINDVFSNKQIITNQDFNYEYYINNKKHKDIGDPKLLLEEMGYDLKNLNNDDNFLNNKDVYSYIDSFNDTLKQKALLILARTIFNNMILNLNKNADPNVLSFFKKLHPTIKINVDLIKNVYKYDICFNYSLQTNLSKYLFKDIDLDKMINIYDTFYSKLELKTNNDDLSLMISLLQDDLAFFNSISPVINNVSVKMSEDKFIGREELVDLYSSFSNLIHTNHYVVPSDIDTKNWHNHNNQMKYNSDLFMLSLRHLYDDFTKNLMRHYEIIKTLDTKDLKNNLQMLKNNEIDIVGLDNKDYFYYNDFYNKLNNYCIEENKHSYNFDILPYFLSSVDHSTSNHYKQFEQIVKNGDVIFYLKCADKVVLPFSFNDLIYSSLEDKKNLLQNDIEEKKQSTSFIQAIDKLNKALQRTNDENTKKDRIKLRR